MECEAKRKKIGAPGLSTLSSVPGKVSEKQLL